MYAIQKFRISKIFLSLSSAHQDCIYLIKNTKMYSLKWDFLF